MTPDLARTLFATFSDELKSAMKGAATRNGWQPEDWVWHVGQVQATMLRGGWTAAEAAECYRGPPPKEKR